MTYRETMHSEEGFSLSEQAEYEEWLDGLDDDYPCPEGWDCIEGDDGQPDEYTEWQDLYGGDDWDHGQYDETY